MRACERIPDEESIIVQLRVGLAEVAVSVRCIAVTGTSTGERLLEFAKHVRAPRLSICGIGLGQKV